MKPSFFQNEQLAALPFEARLLFVGLWCMADREGRLEDRPLRIKMNIFPGDSIDVEPLLDGLERQGLIERYESHDIACIQIPKFIDHQKPHPNEVQSKLPKNLRTKEESTSHQGTKDLALNPDVLNPDVLNPLPTVESARARATRLPEEFSLTPERRLVAEAEKLPADRTFAKFCDYWRAASGAKARKHDWDATWRNWCRSEADRSRGATSAPERKTRYEQMQEALRNAET